MGRKMSTQLIDQDSFNGEILLNTFWGGAQGICSQLTIANSKSYTQMKLDEMILFFETGLERLKNKRKGKRWGHHTDETKKKMSEIAKQRFKIKRGGE